MPEKTISELSAIKSVYSRNTADNDFLWIDLKSCFKKNCWLTFRTPSEDLAEPRHISHMLFIQFVFKNRPNKLNKSTSLWFWTLLLLPLKLNYENTKHSLDCVKNVHANYQAVLDQDLLLLMQWGNHVWLAKLVWMEAFNQAEEWPRPDHGTHS